MTIKTNEVSEFIPIVQKSGFTYIEPPTYSDAIKPEDGDDITMNDMNLFSKSKRMLNVLGKALFKFRTGTEKENVLLLQLPTDYVIKRKGDKHSYYIVGHPSGRALNTALFVPHLIWLERGSDDYGCSCKGCTLPPLDLSCPSLDNSTQSLTHQIDACTVESLKMLQKVVIEPPNDIYCKTFTVPLPRI